MYIRIVEADRTAVTVGYRNHRKNNTHANSKTPPRQLQNIVQYVIACMTKVYVHHANATTADITLEHDDTGEVLLK